MWRKNIKIILLFFSLFIQKVYCQEIQEKLFFADSLFQENKLEEAFIAYFGILNNEQKFTNSMLLKMAFIQEKQGNYTLALYYLNLLYQHYPNKNILSKMEELAERHHLKGYSYNDLEYFISLYNQFYIYILATIFFISFLFILNMIIKRRRREGVGARPIFLLVFLIGAFYMVNFDVVPAKAIIKNNNTLLMSAPSAGANKVEMVTKGHRVNVYGKDNIWYRIKWQDSLVYVRENNLLLINQNN